VDPDLCQNVTEPKTAKKRAIPYTAAGLPTISILKPLSAYRIWSRNEGNVYIGKYGPLWKYLSADVIMGKNMKRRARVQKVNHTKQSGHRQFQIQIKL
jgi:hypothetical protein